MRYKITFLDYWHLSSGLSAGAKYDSTVVKDKDGIPYVPAKTLKGLFREQASESLVKVCFGNEGANKGECYFSNATLDIATIEHIKKEKLQSQLFDEIKSTKIDENGIAKTGSLREIEVVVPITLYATIENIPTGYVEDMEQTIKKVKRMGLNRNRGLGRCKIEVVK